MTDYTPLNDELFPLDYVAYKEAEVHNMELLKKDYADTLKSPTDEPTSFQEELYASVGLDAPIDQGYVALAKTRTRLDRLYSDLSELQTLLYKLETEYSVLSYENAELKSKLKACEENKQYYIGRYERLAEQTRDYVPDWQVKTHYRPRNWVDDILTVLTFGAW